MLLSENSGQIGSSRLVWPEALKCCCWTLLLSAKMFLLCMDSVLNTLAGEAAQKHKPVLPAQAVAPYELPEMVSHRVSVYQQRQQCLER